MRQKIVAGNWKMNKTYSEAIELIHHLHEVLTGIAIPADVSVVVCPPFPYIQKINDLLLLLSDKTMSVGAQNCHEANGGAFTGEISASMLASIGAKYVILGHSERRAYCGESHELLKSKTETALANGLEVIFCCGENLQQREANEHFDVVATQLRDSLFHLSAEQWQHVVLAYEPVWAIGTGKTASPDQAQAIHAFIRQIIAEKYGNDLANAVTILYGGSCNAANADELFACPDIDGGLIGGAALKAKDFAAIVTACCGTAKSL